jgi:intraflagellar transport protein 140
MGHKQLQTNEDGEIEEVKKDEDSESSMIIVRKPMKDFVGLENVDETIRKAIMNFSHYLTVGNMDEAYNSVRNIKNQTVWQNMA